MDSQLERRSAPRVAVEYPVFYYYLPPNAARSRMIDLSVGGAAVEAPDPFPIGSTTSFVCVMGGGDVVEFTARVISVRPMTDEKFRIGVAFTHLSDTARQRVAEATHAYA